MRVVIGVPRERREGERRVALLPDAVKRLAAQGHQVVVERDAGAAAFTSDQAYREAGAEIAADFHEVAARADIVVKVRAPEPDEAETLRAGQIVVGMLQPLVQLELVETLRDRGVTSFSLDALPRITRAQSMDVLSSQATVAGYRAVILAAGYLPKLFPLLITAAGTVTPARVLVLGAGVAGLQAIATAKRLGAQVQAFDIRPAVQEQVQSLGATFLTLPLEVQQAETQGGYARRLEADLEAKERALLTDPVAGADVVVATAMVPGSKAPTLVSREMVEAMRPGSVIMDLAAEAGGNCELTVAGQVVRTPGGVVIDGSTDLPSQLPVHASQLYSHNLHEFLGALLSAVVPREGAAGAAWELDLEKDEIIRATCITHDHAVRHAGTAERLKTRGGTTVVQ
jgi:NAD(P) transhydrogenase subunit alpha